MMARHPWLTVLAWVVAMIVVFLWLEGCAGPGFTSLDSADPSQTVGDAGALDGGSLDQGSGGNPDSAGGARTVARDAGQPDTGGANNSGGNGGSALDGGSVTGTGGAGGALEAGGRTGTGGAPASGGKPGTGGAPPVPVPCGTSTCQDCAPCRAVCVVPAAGLCGCSCT